MLWWRKDIGFGGGVINRRRKVVMYVKVGIL